jgi:hypothetical protein
VTATLFDQHSEDIDHFFGLRINEVERGLLNSAKALRPEGNMSNFGEVLHGGHQTWVGLDPQTLNTPYGELVQLCHLLNPLQGELMVDLGAGFGRLGLVLHRLYPLVTFKGFELVDERVKEGNRVFLEQGCSQAMLYTQDLMDKDFVLPLAQYYFLYDFGKVDHIRRTLHQLETLADHHHFKVIARGKGSRSIIDHEHPWLSAINDVHHEENFSIYTY